MYTAAVDRTFRENAAGSGESVELEQGWRPRSQTPSAGRPLPEATSELIAALEYRIGLDGDLFALADTLEILADVVRRKAARPQRGGTSDREPWSGRSRSSESV